MTEKPCISVIIAAHNEEKYIKNCLEVLLRQLTPDDEIIVVDNNSTDKTANVVRSLKIKLVNETKQGQSFAYSKGFDIAKNNIIARTDADTLVHPEWLNTIRDFFAPADNSLVVITGPVFLKEFLPLKYGVHQGLANNILGHEALVGSNVALTKQMWQRIKPHLSYNDVLYAEDVEMARITISSGGQVRFIPAMVVYTSGRWMIRRPIKSFKLWSKKMKNTKRLLGIN